MNAPKFIHQYYILAKTVAFSAAVLQAVIGNTDAAIFLIILAVYFRLEQTEAQP